MSGDGMFGEGHYEDGMGLPGGCRDCERHEAHVERLRKQVSALNGRLAASERETQVAYEHGLNVAITELLRHADGHGATRSGHSERVCRSLAELCTSSMFIRAGSAFGEV